jgi:hypothetical protein
MGQPILFNKTKRKRSDNSLTNSSNQIPYNCLERGYVQKELYNPKGTGVSSVHFTVSSSSKCRKTNTQRNGFRLY